MKNGFLIKKFHPYVGFDGYCIIFAKWFNHMIKPIN